MTSAKRKQQAPDTKTRIADYLKRRSIRSLATSVKTSEIADSLHLEKELAWRTLDSLHEEDAVERYPKKRGGIKYLKEDKTGKAFFPPDDAERKLGECAEELVELVQRNPRLLTVLGCNLNDITDLTNLSRLAEYNRYVNKLTGYGVKTGLSTLSWQTMAVRWWLG